MVMTMEIIEEYEINEVRAIDFYDAIDLGLEPSSYDKNIPVGVHQLRLHYKIWGKNMSLRAYFQDMATGNRYQVTFYTSTTNRYRYSASDKLIDFSERHILGNIYELHIGTTRTGKPKAERAILIDYSS